MEHNVHMTSPLVSMILGYISDHNVHITSLQESLILGYIGGTQCPHDITTRVNDIQVAAVGHVIICLSHIWTPSENYIYTNVPIVYNTPPLDMIQLKLGVQTNLNGLAI